MNGGRKGKLKPRKYLNVHSVLLSCIGSGVAHGFLLLRTAIFGCSACWQPEKLQLFSTCIHALLLQSIFDATLSIYVSLVL